jgi:glycosyltransferase involved in cell wall biosynthesis
MSANIWKDAHGDMKAVVVSPYYHPRIGGLETYARQLAIGLRELKQWSIAVMTANHAGRRTVIGDVDGMKVYRLGTTMRFSNTPLNPRWPLQMRRILHAEQPDVIIAHTPVPSLADAARMAADRSTPFVVVYHAATLLKGDSILFDMVARTYHAYERLLLHRADVVCAVSDYVKCRLPARFHDKTKVVTNAVWRREFVAREQPGQPHFLFVGSLDGSHAWKGLKLIIEAVGLVRQRYGAPATLAVMGDGDNRDRYQALARSYGLERAVTFLGNRTGSEKDAAFRRSMALVAYPTSANDAFPTVMLEAWARQVPVVAAEIGALSSLVRDREDGYLAGPGDATVLARTLRTVAGSTGVDRARIAAAAQERALQSNTWEIQTDLVHKLVEELCNAKQMTGGGQRP